MNNGITKENLLRHFSTALAEDEDIAALADAVAEQLAKQPGQIRLLLIYPNTDNLPEDLLDILAQDFNVYWWDGNASLETKRRIIKNAPASHRVMGTVAATKKQADAFFPGSTLEEWFNYGGDPGYFRLCINITDSESEEVPVTTVADAEARLLSTKRWSAHLESVSYMIRHVIQTGCRIDTWQYLPPRCGLHRCGTLPET